MEGDAIVRVLQRMSEAVLDVFAGFGIDIDVHALKLDPEMFTGGNDNAIVSAYDTADVGDVVEDRLRCINAWDIALERIPESDALGHDYRLVLRLRMSAVLRWLRKCRTGGGCCVHDLLLVRLTSG